MKWKSSKIACMNKMMYKRLSSAKDQRDYQLKKFGSKQFIYICNEGIIPPHYHLTTQDIKEDRLS